jgi:hypothetical protein
MTPASLSSSGGTRLDGEAELWLPGSISSEPLTPHWPVAAHPRAGSPLQAIVSEPPTVTLTNGAVRADAAAGAPPPSADTPSRPQAPATAMPHRQLTNEASSSLPGVVSNLPGTSIVCMTSERHPSVDPSPEVVAYVTEHAPELDPKDVSTFLEEHPKPDDEPGSHIGWAVHVLRERGEGEVGDGLPVDRVVSEIRRRDR